jgi:hypothetical protein
MATKLDPKAVQLPDGPGTKATVIGNRIVFVEISHWEGASNPLTDSDANGTIHSLNRHHMNSVKNQEEFDALIQNENHVKLGYHEHGNCLWFVSDRLTVVEGGHTGLLLRDKGRATVVPDMQWDTVQFAGIWIPDDCLLDELKDVKDADRRAKLLEWAGQACELYTKWCNGETYEYSLKVYKVRRDGKNVYDNEDDYRFEDPIAEDNCCGYYGWDDVVECTTEAINGLKLNG